MEPRKGRKRCKKAFAPYGAYRDIGLKTTGFTRGYVLPPLRGLNRKRDILDSSASAEGEDADAFSAGNRGSCCGRICDRVPSAPCPRPSNPERIDFHHDEVRPSERPGTAIESSNPHATCICFPPDTNNRRPERSRRQDCGARLERRGAPGADQF